MTEQLANSVYSPSARLVSQIGSNDISLTVDNVLEMPNSGEFRICVWDGVHDTTKEIVKVGAIDKNSKVLSSLTRAVEGINPAQTHAANSWVDVVLTKDAISAFVAEHSSVQPLVGCTLISNSDVDVHAIGSHYPIWTDLWDNAVDGNPLSAIPDGLGLSFIFDGTGLNGAIIVIDAGFYAVSYSVYIQGAPDATFEGSFGDSYNGVAFMPGGRPTQMTDLGFLPAGTSLLPTVTTEVATTYNPASAHIGAELTRL